MAQCADVLWVHACRSRVCAQLSWLHCHVTRGTGPRRGLTAVYAPSPGGHMKLLDPVLKPTQAESTGPFQQPRRLIETAGRAESILPGPQSWGGKDQSLQPTPPVLG